MNVGQWSYAVPLEETDGNARYYPLQRDSHWEENGNPHLSKTLEKRNSAWDLQSDSETTKQRRTSMRVSNNNAVRKRSKNQLRDTNTVPLPKHDDDDDSAWIHRDKLAQIEIQEMAEAGIYIRPSRRSQSLGPGRESGRTSRSASRSGARRSTTEQLHAPGYDDDYVAAYPIASPYEDSQQQPAQQREPDHLLNRDSEVRAVEGAAEDHNRYDRLQSQPQQQSYSGRPSTSRIPVSRISPVPVPQNVVGRDSPLPRSRAGSTSVSNSWDESQYARKARSASISSQVLLDSDPEATKMTTHSSGEGSPPKARTPKNGPTGRKSSIPSAVHRPGSSSANKRAPSGSATKRPGSSSGYKTRPSTGHFSPEGEAPWIATMYKPDPRLPPDQQMLPTHAKRMMQEQWEKQGKTGTVYDRDFNLLNDEEPKPKVPVLSLQSQGLDDQRSLRNPSPSKSLSPNGLSPDGLSPNGSAAGNGWPLIPKGDSGSVRPGTSGRYRITPTIQSTPTIERSNLPSPAPPQSLTSPPLNPTPRIPDLDEKQEAAPKKGCCCVVM